MRRVTALHVEAVVLGMLIAAAALSFLSGLVATVRGWL